MMKTLLIAILAVMLAWTFPRNSYAAEPTGAGLGQERITVDEKTEAVIRGALKWLAKQQNGNGSWSSDRNYEVAMTGYVLMAYLAAGQLPDEGEYGRNVTAGMSYLLQRCKPDGLIFDGSAGNSMMYSHGIATIALAEIYGQTKDIRLKSKVEAAIKLIVNCQNDEGGWRYQPRVADADISVTVLQVVALRAAKNAGLAVPQATIERAVKYVQSCYHPRLGAFCYQARSGNVRTSCTAAAIYSLQVCGRYDDPTIPKASQYLFDHLNNWGEFFTYGQFYAAPAQYMIGGDTWEKWYRQMREMLLGEVLHEGDAAYWEPTRRESRREGGAIYTTAVFTHILAMPYHYVPLYQR